MFTGVPPRARRIIRGELAIAWLLSFAAGLSTVLSTPTTIVAEVGPVIIYGGGVAGVVSTALAAYGVLSDRYRFEWLAAWVATLAMLPYAGALWLIVSQGGNRWTQAFSVSSLIAFYLHRAVSCAAHAAKLRAAHASEGAASDE